MLDAIERAGSLDPKAINEAMAKTNKTYEVGTVKYNADHVFALPSFETQWQNGSNSKPSAFISSCSRVRSAASMRPGWLATLARTRSRFSRALAKSGSSVLAAFWRQMRLAARKTPGLIAQRRNRLLAAGVGVLQLHQQPLRAVQMIAQNDHDNPLLGRRARSGACGGLPPAVVLDRLCSHRLPAKKAPTTSRAQAAA